MVNAPSSLRRRRLDVSQNTPDLFDYGNSESARSGVSQDVLDQRHIYTLTTETVDTAPHPDNHGISLAQSLNEESHTRLILDGTQELLRPLQMVGHLAMDLDRVSWNIHAADTSGMLRALYASVSRLGTAVQELECRTSLISSRLGTSTDGSQIVHPFLSLPESSLIARAMQPRNDPVTSLDTPSTQITVPRDLTLQVRLAQLVTSLQDLIRRLGQVAHESRMFRTQRFTRSGTENLMRQDIWSGHREHVHASLQELNISQREIHSGLQVNDRGSQTSRGFSTTSLGRPRATMPPFLFNSPACLRTSKPEIEEIDRPAAQQPAGRAMGNVPVKFASSHEPIVREPEKLFYHDIEYRNCFGLWLSITGIPIPDHAMKSFLEHGKTSATDAHP